MTDAATPKLIDWESEITARIGSRPAALEARTYLRKWGSASKPFLVVADDGHKYVVKSGCAGRQIVNDQIIGRIGEAIGAPTGRVALVHVSQELIDATPELRDLIPGMPLVAGTWHASRFVTRYSDDREGIHHTTVAENRSRFAKLSALYGWAHASDHQFLYAKDPPPFVLSVDHGHFFPSGPEWTEASLQNAAPAIVDATILGACNLDADEIKQGVAALNVADPIDVIATAVAIPMDHWQIQMSERVAMANYLHSRQQEILAAHAA